MDIKYINFENKLDKLIHFISKSKLNIKICHRSPFGTIYFNDSKYIINCMDYKYMIYELLSIELINNLEIDWKNHLEFVHFRGQFESPSDIIKAYYKLINSEIYTI
jgi:hypothetical protein